MDFKQILSIENGAVKVKDLGRLREVMDDMIFDTVFEADEETRKAKLLLVKEACKAAGAIPASIEGLYEAMGKSYPGFTVPAMNIRGMTYDSAKAVFRTAKKLDVNAMIFEIARSEIGYTKQQPLEYSTVVLAAAVKEGYAGPVFIQGDHFQVILKNYKKEAAPEVNYVKDLIKRAIDAEFYNIDIDTSTLVDLTPADIKEQQRPNFSVAAELAAVIRSVQPKGVTVSIGGEIGEIGGKNSNADELRAFIGGFNEIFKSGTGMSKLSVQTGTSHGGVVLPDGTLAKVKIDFDTLAALSEIARKEFGLSGCVQHGASTLPDEAFDMFPKTTTSEVHLATGFQNILFDNPALPADFKKKIYDWLHVECASEKKEGETEEQFIYKTRKKGFGPQKKDWWTLPADVKAALMGELEAKFELLFNKLKVNGTTVMVNKNVKPVCVPVELPEKAKSLLS